MANPLPLVALPDDDIVWGASGVSMSNPDSAYPASNLLIGDPAHVAKATGSSSTITITTPSRTIVGAALINTNATAATVNGQALVIPPLDLDGQRVNGWLDLRLAPITATSWVIALSGATGQLKIGRVVLVTALEELNMKYGLTLGRLRPGDVEVMTRGGSRIRHTFDIRIRTARGMVDLVGDYQMLMDLEAGAKGTFYPFLFIPDENSNDAWWVAFHANDFTLSYPDYDVRGIPLAFDELSMGPPNG